MRLIAALLALGPLAACSAGVPDLDSRLSAEARAADFPALVPLDPLLAQIDAPGANGTAAAAGTTLEARAENLRRRAARLRAMPL